MNRGPTTFSLILALLAVALLLASGLSAALWVHAGERMIGGIDSRLVVSTALAADELWGRSDASSAAALLQMQNLGLRFSSAPPPPPRIRGAPLLAELGRSAGTLIGDPSRVAVTQSPEPEIWIRSARDPQTWIVLKGTSYRGRLIASALLTGGIAVFVVLVLSALVARVLTRPLERLALDAPAWLHGALPDSTLRGSPREVRHLAAAIGNAGENLRKVAHERELMLAGISHDLRTPLARLRVALELGDATDPTLSAAMTADLEELDAALEQCLAFVREGRDEAPRRIDLTTITGQLLTLRHHPEEWSLDGPPTVFLTVRPTLMRRALGNLMENAERYGRAPFEMSLRREGARICIRIADSGPGVSETLLGRLCRPFVRGDAARGGGGSGLGLSIVARAVELHGGTLRLRNRDSGGFEARISLPDGPGEKINMP
ncbi:MAG TPA: ATP-binding protein [Steroidobacteraceae bacterium]